MDMWKKRFHVLLVLMMVLSLLSPATVQVHAEEPTETEQHTELESTPESSELLEEGTTESGETLEPGEPIKNDEAGEETPDAESSPEIKDAEQASETDKAVVNVQALIDALPTVEVLTVSDELQLQEARTAFDALTDEQKQLIINERLLAELEQQLQVLLAQPVVLQQDKLTEQALTDTVNYFSQNVPSISGARSYTELDIETELLLGLKGAGIDIASFNWGENNSPFDEGTFWASGTLPATVPKNNPYYLNALLGSYVLEINPYHAFGNENSEYRDVINQLKNALSTSGSSSGTFSSLKTVEQSSKAFLALHVLGLEQLGLNPDYTLEYLLVAQYNKQNGLVSKKLDSTAWAMIVGAQYPDVLKGQRALTVWGEDLFQENPFNKTITYLKENPQLIKEADVQTVATFISGLVAIGEDVNDPSWPLGDNGEFMSITHYLVSKQQADGSFGSEEDNVVALIALGDVQAGQTIYERLKTLKNITKTIQLKVEGPSETLFDGPVTLTDYPEVTLQKLVEQAVPAIDLTKNDGHAKWYHTTDLLYVSDDFTNSVVNGENYIVYYGAKNATTDGALTVDDITFTKDIQIMTPVEIMSGKSFEIQVSAKANDYDSANKIKTGGYEVAHNISGANLTFNGDVYTTNSKGIVEIPGEKTQVGEYELQVSKDIEGSYPRMLRQAKKIIVQEDETSERDIQVIVEGPTKKLHEVTVTLKENKTVYDASIQAFEKLGIPYNATSSTGIITAIDGIEQAMFEGWDGWNYTTNNIVYSLNNIKEQSLQGIDQIIWYYGADGDLYEGLNSLDDNMTLKPVLTVVGEARMGQDLTLQLTAQHRKYAASGNLVSEKTIVNLADATVRYNGNSYQSDEQGRVTIPAAQVKQNVTTLEVSHYVENSYPKVVRTDFTVQIEEALIEVTDKTALQSSIEKAEKMKADVNVSTEGKDIEQATYWVTQAELDSYVAIILSAQQLLTDEASTQEVIDATVLALNQASDTFEQAKKDGLKMEAAVETEVKFTVTPKALSLKLYDANNQEVIIGQGEVGTYKIYTANLLAGEYRYEGFDQNSKSVGGGKLTITAEPNQAYAFRQLNFKASNSGWVVDEDYTIHVGQDSLEDTSLKFGEILSNGQTPVFALVGKTLFYSLTPHKKHDEMIEFSDKVEVKIATSAQAMTKAIAFSGNVKFTVPEGAELFIGQKSKHFVEFTEQKSEGVVTSDGLKTYSYQLKDNAEYNYRVSQEGKLTNTGVFKATAQDKALEITKEQLEIVSPKAILNKGTYLEGNLYLNINEQNHLKLNEGDQFKLLPLRSWQALIEGVSNYFFEPDFHYEVIQGEDVVAVEPGKPGSYATVKALKSGTAIVKVTFDALKVNGSTYVKDANDAFSAIWPENVGLFVVTVGQGNTDISTGILSNEERNKKANEAGIKNLQNGVFDADIDSVYYAEGEIGAYYTFTPTVGSTVSVLRPEINHAVGTVSYGAAFSTEGVTTNPDSSTTILLVEGRNIVKVEKGGKAEYHVMTARPLGVKIENMTKPNEKIEPGDKVKVTFSGLSFPANKLSGIYNFNGQLRFVGGADQKTITGDAKQYNLTTQGNSVTFTIPTDLEGDYQLQDGHIALSSFGSPIGDHRNIDPLVGKNPNFNAIMMEGYFSIFPDITIPVGKKTTTVDKSALLTAIDTAELTQQQVSVSVDGTEIDPQKVWVTEQELARFVSVIQKAKTVVAQEATQQEIDNELEAVQQAVAQFKLVQKQGEQQDSSDAGTGQDGQQPGSKNTISMSIIVPGIKTILSPAQFEITADETAYSLLKRVTLQKQIQLDDRLTSMGAYVGGIGGFNEFELGSLSGWMYRVNGVFPQVSADAHYLQVGDLVEWVYTQDGGNDVGDGEQTPTEPEENPTPATPDDKEEIPEDKEQPTTPGNPEQDQPSIIKEIEQTVQHAIQQPVAFGSEWDVIALARSHVNFADAYFGSYYQQVVKKATESNGVFAGPRTEHSRVILALSAIGKDATNVGGYNLFEPLHDFNRVTAQGINGSIFALLAFDAQNYTPKFASLGRVASLTANTTNFTTREKLIQHILSNEIAGGGFALSGSTADPDLTAMALQALAPYKNQSDVQAAIDRALDVLSAQQLANAGFVSNRAENVQSAAQVLIALSTLNIDAATDARFVKNGQTILDNIHSFAVEAGGYKHPKNGAVNAMATQQAMQGLIAYERFVNGKPTLFSMKDVVIQDSEEGKETTPPTETEKPTLPILPDVSEQIGTVYTTIRIDSKSTPLSMTPVEIQQGDSAFDLLLRVTTLHGISLSYRSTSYGIYIDGINGVYEFDRGPLSGWMYRVNGEFPSYSANLYTLQPNDVVEWLYTEDLGKDIDGYVEDAATEKPKDETKQPVPDEKQPLPNEIIDVTKEDTDWKLDHTTIQQYVEQGKQVITLQLAPEVFVELPVTSLQQLTLQDDEYVQVTVNVQGNSIITSVVITNGETQKQWIAGKDYVKLRISALPVTTNSVVAQFVNKELRAVPHKIENGEIVIFTKGSGEFTVTEKSVTFNDTAKHANKEDIEYLANRFIVKGKDSTTFAPNAAITRAQFGAMISRALALTAKDAAMFTDTKGKWYEEELQALLEAGITKGKTASTFDPETTMTRQQAAAFMANILAYVGYEAQSTELTYVDASTIQNQYKDAVALLASLGIMTGKEDGTFDANGELTRAQMAKILKRTLQVAGLL